MRKDRYPNIISAGKLRGRLEACPDAAPAVSGKAQKAD
jgi:hypothetical protein